MLALYVQNLLGVAFYFLKNSNIYATITVIK